jgi:hypothetical protein
MIPMGVLFGHPHRVYAWRDRNWNVRLNTVLWQHLPVPDCRAFCILKEDT